MCNNKIRVRANWLTRLLMILCLTLLSGQSVLAQKHGLGDIPLDPEVYQRYLKAAPDRAAEAVESLPGYYDARDEGLVTSVKNQGSCGSCWAFASVGAFESHLAKQYGEDVNLLDLSEQQQVSCNMNMGGCSGGNSYAIRFWINNGPLTENCFEYTASDLTPCVDDLSLQFVYRVSGFHTLSQDDFKISLYNNGPSYWRFDVHTDFFTFWNNGGDGDVYVNQSRSLEGGHAVLLIGWDDNKGAYLCKNSWGIGGPNGDGTFWIAYSGHFASLGFQMANFTLTGDGCGDGICSPEAGRCSDGIDNDCDGLFDCDDSDCVSDPTCVSSCIEDVDCDDGFYCNGGETCVGGVCQPGTDPCDDGVGCTDDSCDENMDTCTHTPNNASCDDNNPCTDDSCDPVLDCQFVPDDMNSCDDDEDDCTAYFCNDGTCVPEPIVLCCGNGVCEGLVEAEEDCNACPEDCISGGGDPAGVCGNFVCEPAAGEDCLSCPSDCRGKQVGAAKRQFCCGDGGGTNPVDCTDPRCTEEDWACGDPAEPYCCGDGMCGGAEDSINCAIDCGPAPSCGDGSCDPGEDSCNCSDDCGMPPETETSCDDGVDNDCDTFTDCDDPECSGYPSCICISKGGSCSSNDECCSQKCLPAGRCK